MVQLLGSLRCKGSDVGGQAAFVDGAKLLRQDDRRGFQAALRTDFAMGREFVSVCVFTRHSGDDDRMAVFIASVVLDDDHRSVAVLLGAYALTQIGIIQLSSLECSVDGNDLLFV